MNLIILENTDKIADGRFSLTGDRAEHISKVLNASTGDKLKVGLLNGGRALAVIEAISKSEVILKCDKFQQPEKPAFQIDLICALPRQQTVKKVLHSAAAMGISNIHFIRANRVEKSYFHASVLKPENTKKFIIDGLSQGCNTIAPKVHIHHYFKKFFQDQLPQIEALQGTYDIKLLAELSTQKTLTDFNLSNTKRILLAIGPEGGWVDFETELMQSLNFEKFYLGPWTLRVENALVASLSQLELVLSKQ